jgi:hypothetical protein
VLCANTVYNNASFRHAFIVTTHIVLVRTGQANEFQVSTDWPVREDLLFGSVRICIVTAPWTNFELRNRNRAKYC